MGFPPYCKKKPKHKETGGENTREWRVISGRPAGNGNQ